jgi:hypothetical protein
MKYGGEEAEKGLKECTVLLASHCPLMISLVWRLIAGFIAISCFSPFLAVSWA